VGTGKESNKLVKPAFLRMELRLVPQMPLSNYACSIPERFKPVGYCHFSEGQPKVRVCGTLRSRIELVTEPLLVPTGQESRARWAAQRARDVTIGESNAILRNRVNVWRPNVGTSLDAQTGIA
jgi:hypothetical protein